MGSGVIFHELIQGLAAATNPVAVRSRERVSQMRSSSSAPKHRLGLQYVAKIGVALTATLIPTLFEEAQSVILSEDDFAAWVKDLSLSNIHADSGIDGAADEV